MSRSPWDRFVQWGWSLFEGWQHPVSSLGSGRSLFGGSAARRKARRSTRPSDALEARCLLTSVVAHEGTIDTGSEVDVYTVTLAAGEKVTVNVDGTGAFNSHVRLFNSSGMELVSNGDMWDSATGIYSTDSRLVFRATMAGTYTIGVSGAGNEYYSGLDPNPSSGGGYGSGSGYDSGSGFYDAGYGSTGSYTLTIQRDLNGAPVTVNDVAESSGGATVRALVLANDSDAEGDWFELVSVTGAMNGVASVSVETSTGYGGGYGSGSSSGYGSGSGYDDGWGSGSGYGDPYAYMSSSNLLKQLNYTPNPGFTGTEVLTYTVRDAYGAQSTGTLTVTVTNNGTVAVNQAPVTVADSIQTNLGTTVIVPVVNNDSDPEGSVVRLVAVSGAMYGTATLRPRVSESVWSHWQMEESYSGGSFAAWYDMNYGYLGVPSNQLAYDVAYTGTMTGTDTLQYTVTDAQGSQTTGTLTVTVNPAATVNQAPVVTNDSATVEEGFVVTLDVLANDSDPEGHTLSILSASTPSSGEVYIHYGMGVTRDQLIYTAGDEPGPVTITYIVSDGQGGQTTGTVTVTVTASPPPVVTSQVTTTNDRAVADLNETVAIRVLSNDSLVGLGTLSISAVSTPLYGSVSIQTQPVANPVAGGPTTEQVLVYIASGSEVGDDTFTYTVTDGAGQSSTATVTIDRWNSLAAAPALSPIELNSASGATVTAILPTVDQNGTAVSLLSFESSPQGTVSVVTVDGQTGLRFVPTPGISGVVVLTYTMETALGGRGTGTVQVTVAPNMAPVATTDTATVSTGRWVTIPVLANDTDADGDAIELISVQSATRGLAQIDWNAVGGPAVVYFSSLGTSGVDQFTYTIRDAYGNESTGQIIVDTSIIDSIRLLNDTGVANDAITTDPTVGGRVNAPEGGRAIVLEFDTNGDGIAEDELPVEFLTDRDSAAFRYVAESLQAGLNTVAVRARLTDASGAVTTTGWQSVSYTLEEQTAPAIQTFVKSAPGTAEAPVPKARVEGTVAGNAAFVRVEFDHDGDGVADGSTYTDATGKFVYDPTGLPAGAITLRARVSLDSVISATPVVGDWSSLSLTVTLAPAPVIQSLLLTRDTGGTGAPTWITEWPEIRGFISTYGVGGLEFGIGKAAPTGTPYADPALSGIRIEIDLNGDGLVDLTDRTDGEGIFQRYLPGLAIGNQTIAVRALVDDPEQGTRSYGAWSTLTFEVIPRADVTPVITSVQLVTHNAQGQRIAPTIVGTVSGALAAGAYVDIQVDGAGETPDITLVVGSNGTFRYAPPSLSTGDHTVRVQVRSYDATTRASVSTGWQATTVTKAANSGPTLVVGGSGSGSSAYSAMGDTGTAAGAVGSTVGAIQGAVNSAASNLGSALAGTINGLASQFGVSASDFNWETPDIQLEQDEDPLPEVPVSTPEGLASSHMPDLDLENDPAFQQAIESAEEGYADDVKAAADKFKTTLQPVLDAYKTAKANQDRIQKGRLDQIKAQKESDLASVQTQAEQMRTTRGALIAPEQHTAWAQIQALELQLGIDQGIASFAWYWDSMTAYSDMLDGFVQIDADFQDDYNSIDMSTFVDANGNYDYQGYMNAYQEVTNRKIDAYQAEELVYIRENARLTEVWNKKNNELQAAFKTAKADLLADEAIHNKERATAVARLNADVEEFKKSRTASIESKAAIDTAKANRDHTVALAGPWAALAGTLSSARATYDSEVAAANVTRLTDRFAAATTAIEAWTTANPGPAATYNLAIYNLQKGAALTQAQNAANDTSAYATQLSTSLPQVISAQKSARITSANASVDYVTSVENQAVLSLQGIYQAEATKARSLAGNKLAADIEYLEARREFLKKEAAAGKAHGDRLAEIANKESVDTAIAWNDLTDDVRYVPYMQSWNPSEPAYHVRAKEIADEAKDQRAGQALLREIKRIVHIGKWAGLRVEASVKLGTDDALAVKTYETGAPSGGSSGGSSSATVGGKAGFIQAYEDVVASATATAQKASITSSSAIATAVQGASTAISNFFNQSQTTAANNAATQQGSLLSAVTAAGAQFASDLASQFQTTLGNFASGLTSAAYSTFVTTSAANAVTQTTSTNSAITDFVSQSVSTDTTNTQAINNLASTTTSNLITAEDTASTGLITTQTTAAEGSVGDIETYEKSLNGIASSYDSQEATADETHSTAMTTAAGEFQSAIDRAYYVQLFSNAFTTYQLALENITETEATERRAGAESRKNIAWATAEGNLFQKQHETSAAREQAGIANATALITGAIGSGTTVSNQMVDHSTSVATASEGATHTVTSAYINADHGYTTGAAGIFSSWDNLSAGLGMSLAGALDLASDAAETAQRTSVGSFLTGRAGEAVTSLTNAVNGLTASAAPLATQTYTNNSYYGTVTTSSTSTLAPEAGQFLIAQANADLGYITSAVSAGNSFGASLQSARSGLRSTMRTLAESVRAAENSANLAYTLASASYMHTVDTTIESAQHGWNSASITANASWDKSMNSAFGGAQAGLVTAESKNQIARSNATKKWAQGIAAGYIEGAENGALFPVVKDPGGAGIGDVFTNLLAQPDDLDTEPTDLVDTIDQANANAGNATDPTDPNPGQTLVDGFNSADDLLDADNNAAEDDRVADVTSVRDTLNTSLETADTTWDSTMTAAGAAFGAAIDGIQDFDWQNVRDFVGTISNARKTAELGALTAQASYTNTYFSSVGAFQSSMATTSVTRATSQAQATADYFVNTALREALAAETLAASTGSASDQALAVAARAKADAFAAFAVTYVGHLTTAAVAAATTSTTALATQHASKQAELATNLLTATTEINEFYSQQITEANNPPPVDDDADDDGVPDPPKPTATESIATQLAGIKSARDTDRSTIHQGFTGQITRRQVSETNTLPESTTPQSDGDLSGGTSSEEQGTSEGGTAAYGEQATPPNSSEPEAPGTPEPTVSISLAPRFDLSKIKAQGDSSGIPVPIEGVPDVDVDLQGIVNRWESEVSAQRNARVYAEMMFMLEHPLEWQLREAKEDRIARSYAEADIEARRNAWIASRVIPVVETLTGIAEMFAGGTIDSASVASVPLTPALGVVVAVPGWALGTAMIAQGWDLTLSGLSGIWDPSNRRVSYTEQLFADPAIAHTLGAAIATAPMTAPMRNVVGLTDEVVRALDDVAPSIVYNVTDDFEMIVTSGRVWGVTEGSVYGLPTRQWWRGWVSKFDMPTRDPGVIIFIDDAAALFKPHPVEGPFSLAKRLFGQLKAGFGDIVIDMTTATRNGNVLTVRNATIGPHVGHSTQWALLRLRGRRYGIEPLGYALIARSCYYAYSYVFGDKK